LLVCPQCRSGDLTVREFEVASGDVQEGVLICTCGSAYPVIRGIPRMYEGCWTDHAEWTVARNEQLSAAGIHPERARRRHDQKRQTQESFGYQWTQFADMTPEFEENFRNYMQPLTPAFFAGKLGLDAGCGFGRHIHYAAKYGAEMIGLDYSAAIESARRNTSGQPNVHLVQADIYNLPFRPATFDFAYSLGVLHHLPDPFGAYVQLKDAVKPGGLCHVWLYSKTRRWTNAALELVRKVSPRIPYPLLKAASWGAAAVDYGLFIYPYKVLRRTRLAPVVEPLALARVKVYAAYPFQVTYADWFDRLSPPIRFYYDEQDLRQWVREAAVEELSITPTGKYGWRLQARVPVERRPELDS
jgi:SAM-dependent methyltransferase